MWEISIIAVSHVLFGIILIASKKKKVRSDHILICWLIIFSLPFLQQILLHFELSWSTFSRVINQSFTLLHGPFLYLYLKEITKQYEKKIQYWPHFIIFSIFYTLFILNPAPIHPGGPVEPMNSDFSLFAYFGLVNIIVFLGYGLLSLQSLYVHRKRIKETFAYENGEIKLVWFTLLPVLFVILTLLNLLIENTPLQEYIVIESLHLCMFLFFTLYLIFFGLRQRQIFPKAESSIKETEPVKRPTDENPEQLQLLEKMDAILVKERLYLNPVLSVYDLAEAVDISRHQISSILNNGRSMNFYQYVNQYRLEEVCKRLEEDTENRFNILDHALDSGFNSKSSFNSLFKTRYGQTPSQYKKSIRMS